MATKNQEAIRIMKALKHGEIVLKKLSENRGLTAEGEFMKRGYDMAHGLAYFAAGPKTNDESVNG